MENTDLLILKETKKILSDYNSWCPRGGTSTTSGKPQECLIYTLGQARLNVGATSFGGALRRIRVSAQRLFRPDVNLVEINDGMSEWGDVPDKERWEAIHKILDHAVELAEAEESKS